MAQPTSYQGSHVAIFLETATPGVFARPCGLTDHTLSFSKNTNTVTVPDCDDPDLPAWIERETESIDFTASGSGILAAEAIDDWEAAFRSTVSLNARIYVGKPDNTANGRYWEGKVHVTGLEVSGARGNKAQASVSIESDGELTYNNVV